MGLSVMYLPAGPGAIWLGENRELVWARDHHSALARSFLFVAVLQHVVVPALGGQGPEQRAARRAVETEPLSPLWLAHRMQRASWRLLLVLGTEERFVFALSGVARGELPPPPSERRLRRRSAQARWEHVPRWARGIRRGWLPLVAGGLREPPLDLPET